ncbi:AIPR protein [Streptomyces sp. ScaeMP-e48]|uniref:AIPR family protein n=1 Tax=Streptomyces sp. ScaeMP-e48 TaxID=1100823 RepID=UPI000823EB5B|nr:AIPR family protein [Streptomyces sp. ScaeMP-e48]SCK52204.1 AIPR protein [Streptomyces sp. ScaeMP-e48]
MEESERRAATAPIRIYQIRTALLQQYQGLIYADDLKGYDQQGYEQRFLSRALTAAAVREVTGCDHRTAGTSVIDGEDDQGIDGVAVTEGTQEVWLVQAKWSDEGKGKLDTNAAHKLIAGLRLIEQRSFDRFNDRLEPIAARVNAAMHDARLKVTLVIAVMGVGTLSKETINVLEDARKNFNGLGPVLEYRVVHAADILRQIREDLAPEPVRVAVRMTNWLRRTTPLTAYQGTVPASNIAEWYREHESRLYEQNLRQALGTTRVNSGMLSTLVDEPENFWLFNNGVTVLCDQLKEEWPGRRRPDEPVHLHLSGVSVVNGAQTVAAAHRATEASPEAVEDAEVTVKVIVVDKGMLDLAQRITETTNTQNHVEQRDFIALDEVQAMIREDFMLSLQRSYVFKRGEPDPAPDEGCSVVHAAIALACAHRNTELVVRAKRDTDLLWERGSGGAYPRLFGERPGAFQIWRSVLVHRAVGTALNEERKRFQKRAADVSQRGDLLVTHLVFQLLDQDRIDDPEYDWDLALQDVPGLTNRVLSWLIHHIDAEYGQTSFLSGTLTDAGRCKRLAELVLRDAERAGVIPDLPAVYKAAKEGKRKPRRPNAVPTLVDHGRITDGTPLHLRLWNKPEIDALTLWLAKDPRRGEATWVNDRTRCIVWAVDGRAYSPTRLVLNLYELAGWEEAPVAVQGPARWALDSGATLSELAGTLLDEQAELE